MGDSEEPLVGFSWRSGSERETTGILMWSQPFLATLPSGEEVGYIVGEGGGGGPPLPS